MPQVPRLNQLCTLHNTVVSSFGDETKQLVKADIPCRFFESSGKITVNEGEYIEYDAYMHIGGDYVAQKGMFVEIGDKQYKIEYAGHTRDLEGNLFMQFLALKEAYAD